MWSIILSAIAFYLVSLVVPGWRVRNIGTAFVVALVYGLLCWLLRLPAIIGSAVAVAVQKRANVARPGDDHASMMVDRHRRDVRGEVVVGIKLDDETLGHAHRQRL